jgi:RimJ/RimL family protein N-acetyltransferase
MSTGNEKRELLAPCIRFKSALLCWFFSGPSPRRGAGTRTRDQPFAGFFPAVVVFVVIEHLTKSMKGDCCYAQEKSRLQMIETGRLLLRPPRVSDIQDIADLWAIPEVTRFIGGVPSTGQESWARLLRYIGHWSALGFGFFAVFDKADSRFLGEVGLMDFKRDMTPSLDGFAEAGWVFRPDAQGKGFAREALAAVLDWHDARTPVMPVACIIAPENAPSIRLAEATGFAMVETASYKGEPTLVLHRSTARP